MLGTPRATRKKPERCVSDKSESPLGHTRKVLEEMEVFDVYRLARLRKSCHADVLGIIVAPSVGSEDAGQEDVSIEGRYGWQLGRPIVIYLVYLDLNVVFCILPTFTTSKTSLVPVMDSNNVNIICSCI